MTRARHAAPLILSLALALAVLAACAPAAPAAPTPAAAPTPPAAAPAVSPAALPSPSPSLAVPSPSPALAASALPTADPAVHLFLWGNAATTDRDLALAHDGGFHWVKQRFEWRNIEGKAKGQFEWNEPDRIVDAVAAHGLRVVARVDNQPRWASTSVVWPGSGPPDRLADWTDYLTALATRYRGRIQAYEVWNEPNLAREWGDKSPDPAAYTALLSASYQAIKAADPAAQVISAGLSPTTESSANAVRDVDFARAMYANGLKGHYDVFGVHAAGYKAPPCADPGEVAGNPDLTNHDPSPPDVRRVYAFRHVEDLRALMVEQGEGARQMAVLETGWTTDQVHPAYAWFAVSRQQQADNLVGAFQCARQHWSPWLGLMTVIYIPDPAWNQQSEQYWWSITNPDGTLRPAYTALKEFLTS